MVQIWTSWSIMIYMSSYHWVMKLRMCKPEQGAKTITRQPIGLQPSAEIPVFHQKITCSLLHKCRTFYGMMCFLMEYVCIMSIWSWYKKSPKHILHFLSPWTSDISFLCSKDFWCPFFLRQNIVLCFLEGLFSVYINSVLRIFLTHTLIYLRRNYLLTNWLNDCIRQVVKCVGK